MRTSKNYLYYFEFFCGTYENSFYKQLTAENERDAILQVVSYFMDCEPEAAEEYLNKEIGRKWTVEKFWRKSDRRFHHEDWFAAYTLLSLTEIDFDLRNL